MSGTLKSGIVYLGPYTWSDAEFNGKIEISVSGTDDGVLLSRDDLLELLEVFNERDRSRVPY